MYIEPLLLKNKIKNENEYGSARFSTIAEIKKNFKKEKIRNIKETGVPILFDKKLKYMWIDRITPHYIYIGSTGSGKSVTAVIPFCSFAATARKKRSVFITDPKGEIYNTTSSMFKNNGYDILTIDFRHPELSNKFNILEPIIKEYEKYIKYEELYKTTKSEKLRLKYNNLSMTFLAETNRLITSLSSMIMVDKMEPKDPFWNNSAKNLLEGLIGFYLEEYKGGHITRNQITMNSIRKFQNSSMQDINLSKFKNYISSKEYGTKSKDSLTSILTSSDSTFKSITAVFGEKMAIFDDINVANVTCKSDFDFDVLGRKPTALYVIVPDEDKMYFTLVTIIVGLLYKELVKLANTKNDKALPVKIDWILDEFANCPPLFDIESIVSVSRSRGMRFHFFIQSFSQLNNVYGKEVSQIILDNAGLCYLKTNTMDTAEIISKMLGKTTISNHSISQSIGYKSYRGNESTSLMARELMTPDEIKQLHYKTIIFPIIGYPIIRNTVIYKKLSSYTPGEVERKERHLENLKNTYFVVEDIKTDDLNEEVDFNSMIAFDKDCLKEAETIIHKILKDKDYNLKYNTINDRTYIKIRITSPFLQKDKSMLRAKINKDKYHLEIKSVNDNTVVEIHNNSFGINESNDTYL